VGERRGGNTRRKFGITQTLVISMSGNKKGEKKPGPIYCPRCGSDDMKWNQPWLGQIYDCRNCGYRGSLVVQNGELAKRLRRKWLERGGAGLK